MPLGTKRKMSLSRRRKGVSGASMKTKRMKKRKSLGKRRRARNMRMMQRMKN